MVRGQVSAVLYLTGFKVSSPVSVSQLVLGMKLNMKELRPKIVEAQDGMKRLYSQAFDEAFAGAGPTLEKIKQLKKDGPKKERQPGGKDLDIFGLFKGALGAIGELWAYGLEVREASGEHDAELSWGLKWTSMVKRAVLVVRRLATTVSCDCI